MTEPTCGDPLDQDGWRSFCGEPIGHDLPHHGFAVRTETSEVAMLDWVQDDEDFDVPSAWEGPLRRRSD